MYSSLMLGLALAVAAPAPKAEAKKEPASPVGTWVGVKAVAGGKEKPVPEGGIEFTLTADGKFLVREGKREAPEGGTYTTDAKKEPAKIDIIAPAGKVPTLLGIYKIDGDVLTLAIAMDGARKDGVGARPTKFESPEGSEVMLMTMKRMKKDEKKDEKKE
jgi:uncharacterized protein (TIGR03067 family)